MSELAFLDRYREAKRRLWGLAIEKTPPARVVVRTPAECRPKVVLRDWLFVSSLTSAKAVTRITPVDVGHRILSEVCLKHGIQHHELLGTRRHLHLISARSEAYARLVSETNWSLPKIGEFVGRDHTTLVKVLQRHHPQFMRRAS